MDILEILKAAVFGIIEGITEWLPVSSTGHLILIDEFLKLTASESFKEMFFVVIQLGAILAVIASYWRKLLPFTLEKKPVLKKETLSLWGKILIACIPAAIVGLLFDDTIDALFYNFQTVAITLIVYGVLFILIEKRNEGKKPAVSHINGITAKTALMIGVFQLLALIPGTSRSGATIIGAMLFGMSRIVAAEFTFYLAIPVMFGASFLKLLKFGFDISGSELMILLVGMIVAFAVSMFVIRFLITFIKKHSFKVFGWYRIFLGILVLSYFLLIK